MRAVVVGAGIAGLTAAWWLDRLGWDVVVLERSPEPRTAGYLIDFFGPGYEVAERMGLLPALEPNRTLIAALQYVDPSGRPRGAAGYDAFADAADGRLMSLPRGALAAALLDALPPSVELRWGADVRSAWADDERAGVQLADDGALEADLLVGCDGLHSQVRRLVAPGDRAVRPLGFHTAAYVLEDPDLQDAVGSRMLMTAVPGRQVGLYPMGDGSAAAWFVHESELPVPDDPAAALRATYRGMGPLVDRALTHCPAPDGLYYDLVAQVAADRWRRGRAVLVGDSCQAPSLMAGQGASMAMAGAWALAHHLGTSGDKSAATDIASGLDAYVAAMRPFAEQRQARGRSTARWLLPGTTAGIRARQAFLAAARLRIGRPLVRAAFAMATARALPA